MEKLSQRKIKAYYKSIGKNSIRRLYRILSEEKGEKHINKA